MALELLKGFRMQLAQCEIVVLADVSAGTVLAWDGALKWPQEDLDALGALAGAVLGLLEGPEADSAILSCATGSHVIQRAAPGRPEVLCSVFAPNSDLEGVIEASQGLCDQLVGVQAKARA